MTQNTASNLPTSGFTTAGPADAPCLVFIHGAAWTRAMWAPQVEALADSFQIVTLDLPGHGALADEPFTMQRSVEVVDRAVSLSGQPCATIIGLSLGGYVAMSYAAHAPERCAGLVLSGCAIEYAGLLGRISQFDATLSLRIVRPSRLAQMQTASLRATYPGEIAEPQIAAGFTFEALPAVYGETARQRFRPLLRQYPGPTLILNGARDRLNRRSEARQLAATQHGQLQVIADAGHLCNLDQPAAFTDAVRVWASAPPAPPPFRERGGSAFVADG